jgi:hypothetical protein
VHKWLQDNDGRVVIYCRAGGNRSGGAMHLCLTKIVGMSPEDAFAACREAYRGALCWSDDASEIRELTTGPKPRPKPDAFPMNPQCNGCRYWFKPYQATITDRGECALSVYSGVVMADERACEAYEARCDESYDPILHGNSHVPKPQGTLRS